MSNKTLELCLCLFQLFVFKTILKITHFQFINFLLRTAAANSRFRSFWLCGVALIGVFFYSAKLHRTAVGWSLLPHRRSNKFQINPSLRTWGSRKRDGAVPSFILLQQLRVRTHMIVCDSVEYKGAILVCVCPYNLYCRSCSTATTSNWTENSNICGSFSI